jgi:hypothetical protein
MSQVILRGRWCNITVLNAHAPTEDKIDDKKGRLYKEQIYVFDKSSEYYIKMLLGDFNVKVGRKDIF